MSEYALLNRIDLDGGVKWPSKPEAILQAASLVAVNRETVSLFLDDVAQKSSNLTFSEHRDWVKAAAKVVKALEPGKRRVVLDELRQSRNFQRTSLGMSIDEELSHEIGISHQPSL